MLKKTTQALLLSLFLGTTALVYAQENSTPDTLEVNIKGIPSSTLTQQVKESLSLVRLQQFALQNPIQLKLLFNQGSDEIVTALQPSGYFDATVSSTLNYNNHTWLADYIVTLGKPLSVSQVNIEIRGDGKNDKHFLALKNNGILQSGDIVTQHKYDQLRKKITDTAFNQGYFDARMVRSQIVVDRFTNTANINIILDTGVRYRIGNIHIKQTRFDYTEDLIMRLLTFRSGDGYDFKHINQSNVNLQNSQYFNSVQVVPNINGRDTQTHTLDVEVLLDAAYARTYTVGLGYSTFSGPQISFGTLFSHVTASGQQFMFDVTASPANSVFSTAYVFPGKNPATDNWSINAQQNYINPDPYYERQTNFGVNWQRELSDIFTINLGVQQYLTGYQQNNQNSMTHQQFLVPTAQFNADFTYRDGFWRHGFLIDNLTQVSVKTPFSDASFARTTFAGIYSLPLMPEWNRFVLSGTVGAINVDNIESVPPNFRFYAGGVSNLLGYQFLSQGPTVNGQVIGGKYLATARASLEQRVYGPLSLLVFYNLGNAANNINFSDVPILKAGGVGASAQTPLGPISAFVARTMNPSDNHWSFTFSIGVPLL